MIGARNAQQLYNFSCTPKHCLIGAFHVHRELRMCKMSKARVATHIPWSEPVFLRNKMLQRSAGLGILSSEHSPNEVISTFRFGFAENGRPPNHWFPHKHIYIFTNGTILGPLGVPSFQEIPNIIFYSIIPYLIKICKCRGLR